MSDEEAIRDLFAAWHEASRQRDVARLLGYVTEDVVFLAPGQPPIRGKDAVRVLFELVFSRFSDMEQNFVIEELQVLGDWAFCWGTDSSVLRPVAGGEALKARGMGLSLLKKQADGSWLFARGINNMVRDVTVEPSR